jgi:hypothetical protein
VTASASLLLILATLLMVLAGTSKKRLEWHPRTVRVRRRRRP